MKKSITKLKTLFIVLFIGVLHLEAQVSDVNLTNLYSRMTVTSFDSSSSNDIKGDSYIVDDFRPAKLAKDKKTFFVRYNAYKDEMEIQRGNDAYYLSRFYDLPITFIGTNEVYKMFDYDKGKKTGYFLLLNEGDKISLLLKQTIKFYEAHKAKTGYGKSEPKRLEREDDVLYYSNKENIAVKLPKKKKDILGLLDSKEKDIESYIKQNDLNLKKKEDLVKLFSFYNS